jgi:hypothetical protein
MGIVFDQIEGEVVEPQGSSGGESPRDASQAAGESKPETLRRDLRRIARREERVRAD